MFLSLLSQTSSLVRGTVVTMPVRFLSLELEIALMRAESWRMLPIAPVAAAAAANTISFSCLNAYNQFKSN